MEDVLDLYQRPYDPDYPVVCVDKQPVQPLKETRQPLPSKPGEVRRYVYEYQRAGTARIFLFTEALRGWRQVNIHE